MGERAPDTHSEVPRSGAPPPSQEAGTTISTERLLLRPFKDADLALYARANADPVVMQYLGGPITSTASDRQALGANACLLANNYGKVAVERRPDGAFVGMCGLSRESWYPDDLEIGWRLLPQHAGHGYATEAARAWINHAFTQLNVGRVISIADVPNHRSIAVMKRLGMQLDHTAKLEDNGEHFEAVVCTLARPAG